MQQVLIRRGKVKDAPAVHALFCTAIEDIPLNANFVDDAHKQWVRAECKKRNVWISERSGELAGIMFMNVDEISYLVTAAEHRKSLVAQALLEYAKARIGKKYRCGVWAKVRPANTPIVRLLEKLGFVLDLERIVLDGWVCYATERLLS